MLPRNFSGSITTRNILAVLVEGHLRDYNSEVSLNLASLTQRGIVYKTLVEDDVIYKL